MTEDFYPKRWYMPASSPEELVMTPNAGIVPSHNQGAHGDTSVKIAVLTVHASSCLGALSKSHWHASSGSMMKKACRRMSRLSLEITGFVNRCQMSQAMLIYIPCNICDSVKQEAKDRELYNHKHTTLL